MTADAGVLVTLVFTGQGLEFRSLGGGQDISDQGNWSVDGSLISLDLPTLGKHVERKRYTRMGNVLILPFKVFSDGQGNSSWQRASTGGMSGGGSGSGGSGAGQGNDGTDGQDGSSGSQGEAGSQGDSGEKGDDGSQGEAGRDGRDLTRQQLDQERKSCMLAGLYEGRAAGEEVRFRHPRGMLVLTVKHNAEFWFHVDGKGRLEGEGTITYDLTRDTVGLDRLVSSVQGLMGMMPVPGAPGGGAKGQIADKMAGTITGGVSGVNQLQYDAPHLKNGAELRHFKFTGRAIVNETRNGGKLVIDEVREYTTADGQVDNKLVAAWEVNLKKEESTFPCWSPFLKESGVFRRGPGALWVIEFQEKGTHREGKKPWQEYGYYWTARQTR